jgi:hypothetical protein
MRRYDHIYCLYALAIQDYPKCAAQVNWEAVLLASVQRTRLVHYRRGLTSTRMTEVDFDKVLHFSIRGDSQRSRLRYFLSSNPWKLRLRSRLPFPVDPARSDAVSTPTECSLLWTLGPLSERLALEQDVSRLHMPRAREAHCRVVGAERGTRRFDCVADRRPWTSGIYLPKLGR